MECKCKERSFGSPVCEKCCHENYRSLCSIHHEQREKIAKLEAEIERLSVTRLNAAERIQIVRDLKARAEAAEAEISTMKAVYMPFEDVRAEIISLRKRAEAAEAKVERYAEEILGDIDHVLSRCTCGSVGDETLDGSNCKHCQLAWELGYSLKAELDKEKEE